MQGIQEKVSARSSKVPKRERKICFRCFSSQSHIAEDCTVNVKCEVCGNSSHATAMHLDRRPEKSRSQSIHSERNSEDHGGETSQHNSGSVRTLCTKLCGNLISGRSCGKIILVDVFPTANPENQKRAIDHLFQLTYLIDLQSLEKVNRTLCHHVLVFQHNMDDT